jgi:hypothetical protein
LREERISKKKKKSLLPYFCQIYGEYILENRTQSRVVKEENKWVENEFLQA